MKNLKEKHEELRYISDEKIKETLEKNQLDETTTLVELMLNQSTNNIFN